MFNLKKKNCLGNKKSVIYHVENSKSKENTFFFKWEGVSKLLTGTVYYKYKYIQNTWLPTTASNVLTSNYEQYINCKKLFIVYLNKYK